jgi:hypothetical protein
MHPTVELLYPARLNLRGQHLFEQGVETPVSFELATELHDNPRFKVRGLNTREAIEHAARSGRPQGEALLEAIREAANSLDVDDDGNFDRNGKPDHRALSDLLGYPVSVEERDRAIAPHAGRLEDAQDGDKAEPKKGGVVIKRASAEAKPKPAPVDEEAVEI